HLQTAVLHTTMATIEMEGLEKLEQVHRTIDKLRSAGISDANPNCERFLVDFTFFLTQPCGELDISLKCQLISQHMSKIASMFSEGALQSEGKDCKQNGNALQICGDKKTNINSARSFCDDVAMVGIEAMMRSNSTSYFMFHKMEVNEPQSVFKYLPMLSFTESYIYQLDGLNEELVQLTGDGFPIFTEIQDDNSKLGAKSVRMFQKDPFRPLLYVLEQRGLLTERIIEELRYGEEYWALERKLCWALASNKEICIEDVKKAIHLKSFDYRVLNLLLYQLRGEKVNELHMEFLSISELLVEISDDLFDYEAKFITEAEKTYDQLCKALDSDLSSKYRQRCEEATKEGGKTCGSSLGTWQMPPIIEDENGYRMAFSSKTP
ncbi:glucose-6-phosphate isomerase, partial [Striga asiatica]